MTAITTRCLITKYYGRAPFSSPPTALSPKSQAAGTQFWLQIGLVQESERSFGTPQGAPTTTTTPQVTQTQPALAASPSNAKSRAIKAPLDEGGGDHRVAEDLAPFARSRGCGDDD